MSKYNGCLDSISLFTSLGLMNKLPFITNYVSLLFSFSFVLSCHSFCLLFLFGFSLSNGFSFFNFLLFLFLFSISFLFDPHTSLGDKGKRTTFLPLCKKEYQLVTPLWTTTLSYRQGLLSNTCPASMETIS